MVGYGLYFFSKRLVNFIFCSSWYDLLIFEFSNSQIFDFLEFFRIRLILSRCSFYFFEFRIIFSTSFYGVYEGFFFFISFLLKYIKTRFSLNKILLQLTGRLFGCCDEFDHQGRPRAQNQN